jgi:polysaccharide deacetylase 2 family uncharacterized protein YibQ
VRSNFTLALLGLVMAGASFAAALWLLIDATRLGPGAPSTAPIEPLAAAISDDPGLNAVAPPLVAPVRVAAPENWKKYAALAPDDTGLPMIAIVIDDVGQGWGRAMAVVALAPPVTLALLPYADRLPELAKAARARGHEIIVHLPMQPESQAMDEGPNGLRLDLDADELKRRLAWNLDRFSGFVGASNHMGSQFTADTAAMGIVLAEISARGLLWLDSRTSPHSLGASLAATLGVPSASRDVFLDNEVGSTAIGDRLFETERIARAKGSAIAIGHPHPATLAALKAWQAEVASRGFQLVPLSAVVARRRAPHY